ncbi:hypothetical protein [Rhodococcus qingshengii]|uniref:hypothetical protein n=1 Tax=Rhodococcus qingshengii TaxID=334542 RepID=UPI001AE0E31D|nr:hypothetical protein [Rhodococcus qingshengii]MCQ4150264.1 hypothetical protein [Rhodococcus qingshengii]
MKHLHWFNWTLIGILSLSVLLSLAATHYSQAISTAAVVVLYVSATVFAGEADELRAENNHLRRALAWWNHPTWRGRL